MADFSISAKDLMVLEYLYNRGCLRATDSISAEIILQEVALKEDEIESLRSALRENNPNATDEEIEIMLNKDLRKANIKRSTLYNIIKKNKEHGIIAEGIKVGYTTTYYLTTKGIELYASLGNISKEEAQRVLTAKEQLTGKWNKVIDNNR